MSAQEIANFTEEMMLSGEVIEMMDVSRPKIEKYSTGGVGDKTSLVLGPLAAASGVAMPMMNGDDEEFLTSTTEKLKAIPKVNTDIDLDDFSDQVRKLGCAFAEVMKKFLQWNQYFMDSGKRLEPFHPFHLSLPVRSAGNLLPVQKVWLWISNGVKDHSSPMLKTRSNWLARSPVSVEH